MFPGGHDLILGVGGWTSRSSRNHCFMPLALRVKFYAGLDSFLFSGSKEGVVRVGYP